MIDSIRSARRRFASAFLLAAATLVATGFARADSIGAPFPSASINSQASAILLNSANTLIERSGLITGSQTVVQPIVVTSAGTFTVRLSDPAWPVRLSALSFAATTSSSVIARMSAPGTMSFDVSGPTTLYAAIFGTTAAPLNLGLYSLQMSFAPVPLPGALGLMLLGLAALRGSARRGRPAR